MRKKQKFIVALVLAFIMATMPILPFAQPMVVMAAEEELTMEERGFIPIREAFEEFDNSVITWNRAARNIHIYVYGVSIIFIPGSNVVEVGEITVRMEHAVTLYRGVAYIHIRDYFTVFDILDMALFIVESDDIVVLRLTEDAQEIALYDFDFIVDVIQGNTPWESVIDRRISSITFQEFIEIMRGEIEFRNPLVFMYSFEELEEFYGVPIYEQYFPIREGDDPRDSAANFLSYFMLSGFGLLEGIGHLAPRDLHMYRIQYSGLRMFNHRGQIDRETNPEAAMRYDAFTHPDVRWFYGEVDVDLYADFETVFPEVPGNIVTEIITPGEVAYLQIHSFATSAAYDDLVIAPFFDEIRDFDHLIIDIRGNPGGFMFNFTHNIMGRLIHEPVVTYTHQFFSGGDIAVEAMNALAVSTQYRFDSIPNNVVNQWYTIDMLPAEEFITEREMTAFNQRDLALLDYVMVERSWVFPAGDDLVFEGKVWLLVDGHTGSAASQATLMLMEAGLATVIGSNTSGVMAAHHTYVILPSTGILFRMDVGYRTDIHGNSLEAYGIAPDVHNFLGMNALETALELIAGAEPPQQFNLNNWQDLVGDNVDFTDHPLTGTWAWDTDESYIYELKPDGTGIRGFYENRREIYWHVYGNNLFIDTGVMIEHWTFEIVDDVLTIVSAQVSGLTWSYIKQ
ncbi:MAG: S41 family peptidase [Defluviitaleaceae bacterium]|nr:S41 family peptidase [Defluviitaleaceae bacterium]